MASEEPTCGTAESLNDDSPDMRTNNPADSWTLKRRCPREPLPELLPTLLSQSKCAQPDPIKSPWVARGVIITEKIADEPLLGKVRLRGVTTYDLRRAPLELHDFHPGRQITRQLRVGEANFGRMLSVSQVRSSEFGLGDQFVREEGLLVKIAPK